MLYIFSKHNNCIDVPTSECQICLNESSGARISLAMQELISSISNKIDKWHYF